MQVMTFGRAAGVAMALIAGANWSASASSTFRAELWDGSAWRHHLVVNPAVNPTVIVRYTASYVGTATPIALSGVDFQPTVSRWTNDDSINFGSTTGNYAASDPRVAPTFSENGPFGRVAAFAYPRIMPADALTAFVNTIAGEPTLRIAQATRTLPPTLDSRGNPSYRGGGVPFAQLAALPSGTVVPDRPDFVRGVLDVPIFGFKITLGPSTADRNPTDATADLTVGGLPFLPFSAARWYGAESEIAASIGEDYRYLSVESATIDIVSGDIPTPGVGGICMASLWCSFVVHRRR